MERLRASAAVVLLLLIASAEAWSPLSIFTSGASGNFTKKGASNSGDACTNTSEHVARLLVDLEPGHQAVCCGRC